jgi:hypothetical protein
MSHHMVKDPTRPNTYRYVPGGKKCKRSKQTKRKK